MKPLGLLLVLFLTTYVLCIKYTVPAVSFLAQFKVTPRMHDSNYDGWILVNREYEPAQIHAIVTHREDEIVYEYNSTMGNNVQMYIKDINGADCKKFYVPMPASVFEAVNNLDYVLTHEQQEFQVDGVFDNAVKNCVQNNTIVTIPMQSSDHVVLCSQNNSPIPSHIIGEKFQLEITDIKTNLHQSKAHMTALMSQLQKCEQMNELEHGNKFSSARKITKKSTPWFLQYQRTCKMDPLRHDSHCTKYEMKRAVSPVIEPIHTCVFLHGVGQSLSDKGPPLFDQWPDYWGNVHLYTPQCKERIFIREETKMRGWNNLDLQQSYCDVALYASRKMNHTDSTIRNTVLFVHSMGNLILAGAINNGLCDIDSGSSSWYQIQGPFSGSKAANMLLDICKYANTGDWPTSKAKLYRYVAEEGGYCIPFSNSCYPGYKTLVPNYCGPQQECIKKLHQIANSRIKGSMCGNSPYGLFSRYGPALKILAQVVGYDEESDGLVPISSCKESSTGMEFSSDYRNKFYAADINHSDGTCRNGDGYFSDYRAPCSYYMDKV